MSTKMPKVVVSVIKSFCFLIYWNIGRCFSLRVFPVRRPVMGARRLSCFVWYILLTYKIVAHDNINERHFYSFLYGNFYDPFELYF